MSSEVWVHSERLSYPFANVLLEYHSLQFAMSSPIKNLFLRFANVCCFLPLTTYLTSAKTLVVSNGLSNTTTSINGTSKDSFLDALVTNMTVPELGEYKPEQSYQLYDMQSSDNELKPSS